jgi:hypothetical protein
MRIGTILENNRTDFKLQRKIFTLRLLPGAPRISLDGDRCYINVAPFIGNSEFMEAFTSFIRREVAPLISGDD